MGHLIDEILQIVRSASTNNIKELRIKQLVGEKKGTNGHWMIDILAPWETIKQICERLNISPSKFRRRWKRRPAGHGQSEVGPTGRIIHVQSDEELDKFLIGTWRLGNITPEQVVGVTIELASQGPKRISKLAKQTRRRQKSSVRDGKAS